MSETDNANRRFVRPCEGRRVRDPITHEVLPEEGREVIWSSFWDRRLIDEDATTDPLPAAPATVEDPPAGDPPAAGRGRSGKTNTEEA